MNSFFKTVQPIVGDFCMDYMMRYSLFVPRLYNLCLSLGFEVGHMMPSRAFCADENQGFPIILLAKHFGAFPFDHGRAGGTVATDLHGPHAHHGNDMVIIQASHVGYDLETKTFGTYCRLQTPDHDKTTTCGKIGSVLKWYQEAYQLAQAHVYLGREGDVCTLKIDNDLLDERRTEGLFLYMDKMVSIKGGNPKLLRRQSTSRVYAASDELRQALPNDVWRSGQPVPIGSYLKPELFFFQHQISDDVEGQHYLELNLIDAMPWIVTSESPLLIAAQVNTQAEFDRTYRTLVKAGEYTGKRLLFISCLHIDISPREGQVFPLTKCIPWAAYIQDVDGKSQIYEQSEIFDMLMQQHIENKNQINLEDAIQKMADTPEVTVTF